MDIFRKEPLAIFKSKSANRKFKKVGTSFIQKVNKILDLTSGGYSSNNKNFLKLRFRTS